MNVFYFLFVIGYLLLAIRQPKWALFLICVLLPTYQIRFKIFGLPTTLLEIMILILFIVWFFKFKISGIRHLVSNIRSWLWLIIAWLIIGLIAVVVAPDHWLALGHWRAYFLEPILLLIVFLNLTGRDEGIKKIVILGLSASALYCAFWAICQKWFGGGVWSLEIWGQAEIWRATGPFPQPNFLGLFLAPIILLAVGQLISNFEFRISNFKKLLVICYWLLVVIAGLTAIILARSEGAILGVLAGLIFIGLFSSKSRKWVLAGLIILIIIIAGLPNLRSYFIQKITFHDFSGQIRLKIWSETFSLLKDRPIFGAGLRGYQVVIEKYHQLYLSEKMKIPIEIEPYPHNLFLAIWSELGILGLIVFLWIIVKFFYQGFKKPESVISYSFFVISLMSAMIAFLVHGAFDTPYFKNDLAILFWLIVGFWLSLINITPRQSAAPR